MEHPTHCFSTAETQKEPLLSVAATKVGVLKRCAGTFIWLTAWPIACEGVWHDQSKCRIRRPKTYGVEFNHTTAVWLLVSCRYYLPMRVRLYALLCLSVPDISNTPSKAVITTRPGFHSGIVAERVLSSALGSRSSPLDFTRCSSWIADFQGRTRFELPPFASSIRGPASPRFSCVAVVGLMVFRFHIDVPVVVGRGRECSVPSALG
jgi:hypothetical protein